MWLNLFRFLHTRAIVDTSQWNIYVVHCVVCLLQYSLEVIYIYIYKREVIQSFPRVVPQLNHLTACSLMADQLISYDLCMSVELSFLLCYVCVLCACVRVCLSVCTITEKILSIEWQIHMHGGIVSTMQKRMQVRMHGVDVSTMYYVSMQYLIWQLWKSNVLYLQKYYTYISEIVASRLPQLDIYYHKISISFSFI